MFIRRYAGSVRFLHWLIAMLFVLALLSIELKGWLPRGSSERALAKWTHMQFGLGVLLFSLVRLAVRLRHAAPAILPPPSPVQMVVARVVHLVLYLFGLAVPLLGIAMMFYGGKPWNVAGLPLPVATLPDAVLVKDIKSLHETLGNAFLWLAVMHAAAAFYHHFIQRDNTLSRMKCNKSRRDDLRWPG